MANSVLNATLEWSKTMNSIFKANDNRREQAAAQYRADQAERRAQAELERSLAAERSRLRSQAEARYRQAEKKRIEAEAQRRATELRALKKAEQAARHQKMLDDLVSMNDSLGDLSPSKDNPDFVNMDESLGDSSPSKATHLDMDAALSASKSKQKVPAVCANAFSAADKSMHRFAAEGRKRGFSFLKKDAFKKLGSKYLKHADMKKYKDSWDDFKSKKERLEKMSRDLDEIQRCTGKGMACWDRLFTDIDKETRAWLEGFAKEKSGTDAAFKRVAEAKKFLDNYVRRLETDAERNITKAASCLGS